MIFKALVTGAFIFVTISGSWAGAIANGVWSPNGCGSEPIAPSIDQSSVENFNNSIKAINDWQQKANTYNSCLINEANTDNALIAKTANAAQAKLREVFEKINKDSAAAKAKLDKQ